MTSLLGRQVTTSEEYIPEQGIKRGEVVAVARTRSRGWDLLVLCEDGKLVNLPSDAAELVASPLPESFATPEFQRFVARKFGVEPNPDVSPHAMAAWRAKVEGAWATWQHLGLCHHEGRMPFAPRAEKP